MLKKYVSKYYVKNDIISSDAILIVSEHCLILITYSQGYLLLLLRKYEHGDIPDLIVSLGYQSANPF